MSISEYHHSTFRHNSSIQHPYDIPEGKKVIVVSDGISRCTFKLVYEVAESLVAIGGKFINAFGGGVPMVSFPVIVQVGDFLAMHLSDQGQIAHDSGYSVLHQGETMELDMHGRLNGPKAFDATSTWWVDRRMRVFWDMTHGRSIRLREVWETVDGELVRGSLKGFNGKANFVADK